MQATSFLSSLLISDLQLVAVERCEMPSHFNSGLITAGRFVADDRLPRAGRRSPARLIRRRVWLTYSAATITAIRQSYARCQVWVSASCYVPAPARLDYPTISRCRYFHMNSIAGMDRHRRCIGAVRADPCRDNQRYPKRNAPNDCHRNLPRKHGGIIFLYLECVTGSIHTASFRHFDPLWPI